MSEIIQVLRVIPSIDPGVGGPSHSAVNAIAAEAIGGIATTLITSIGRLEADGVEKSISKLRAAGVAVRVFPRSRFLVRKAGTWGLSVRQAIWMMRNIPRYEVVHFHYVWSLTTLLGTFRAAAAGVPTVLTAHESLTSYDIDVTSGSAIKRALKLRLRSLIMRRISAVVCASELELSDSIRGGEYGVVIPHPVESASSPRTHLNTNGVDQSHHVGFLGRLHPKKGLERLIRSLRKADHDAYLTVCGEGDPIYANQLRELARNQGVEDRIAWRGYVSGKQKQDFLESVSWLAMPSDYECFGMAAAESLAAGTPVIVTSQTGIAPIIREYSCGLILHDARDESRLDEIVNQALNVTQDQWNKYSANAILARTKALSFQTYASKIASLYTSLK